MILAYSFSVLDRLMKIWRLQSSTRNGSTVTNEDSEVHLIEEYYRFTSISRGLSIEKFVSFCIPRLWHALTDTPIYLSFTVSVLSKRSHVMSSQGSRSSFHLWCLMLDHVVSCVNCIQIVFICRRNLDAGERGQGNLFFLMWNS